MIRPAEVGSDAAKKGWLAMAGFTHKMRSKLVLRIAALATVGIAVSGCTYDVGLGYASDGYGYGVGSGYYDCDPYSPFDSYYNCDNGYGYSNIGYGGGWYDNLWYPGYGFFLFDNYGQRYNMRDSHRRYWGERRHRWYRENRGRNRDGGGHDGTGYTDGATPGAIDRAERYDGRMRDRNDYRNRRGDGRRQRRDQRPSGKNNGADVVPVFNSEVVQGRGDGYGRRQGGNDGEGNALPQPQRERPASARSNRPPPASGQSDVPAYRPDPEPRDETSRQQIPRIRSSEGAVEQPQ